MTKSELVLGATVAATLFAAGVLWERQRPPKASALQEALKPKEAGVLAFPQGAPQLSAISTAPAQIMPIPLAEPLNARVAFDESHTSRVSAPVAGRIVELRAQLGDQVAAGSALAVIDAPDLGAAQSDLAKAMADQNRKELALGRARDLFAHEVLPKKDLEATEADLAQSKAEAQRSALRLANLNPRRAPINGQRLLLVAPFAGVVADRKANPGQEVRPDLPDPLFIITDLRRVQVVIDMPEQRLSKIELGQPIEVEVEAWPGERFSGRVDRIAPVVDPATRRVQVRCYVHNAGLKLRPEMYARVTLLADTQRTALRIPNSSIVTEGLYAFVFVERSPGTFEKRKVEFAVQDREYGYVAGGLKPEERVVVRGALLLNSELASGT